MKRVCTVLTMAAAISIAATACQKIPYKPYLPEAQRGDPRDPKGPGIFTGQRGEMVIYGR